MTEAFTVTLCRCEHPPADHIHEKYMCKAQGCSCKELDEIQVYLAIDARLPEIEGELSKAIDRLKKWGNA
jgi:hypothetical protein